MLILPWCGLTAASALAVLLSFAQAVDPAKRSKYDEPSRVLMRAERSNDSRSFSTRGFPSEVLSTTFEVEGAALLDMHARETITTTELSAGLMETTEFVYESTQAAGISGSWVLVTPDTGLKTQGVPERSTFMRCSSDNEFYVLVDAGANSQGKCQLDAMHPPNEFQTQSGEPVTRDMIRYYQYCEHCETGKKCELVLWCLKVNMFADVTEEGPDSPVWRVYRNGDTVRDMWSLAAGHSMCQLPQGMTRKLGVQATYVDEKALLADHQIACQEFAVKGGHGFYQFCGSCVSGNRCSVFPRCDKCLSFDSTNWHVFKSELAGPPCESNA